MSKKKESYFSTIKQSEWGGIDDKMKEIVFHKYFLGDVKDRYGNRWNDDNKNTKRLYDFVSKRKFDEYGNPQAIPGSNIPLSAAGVFILWLGWFGFNGGSVLSADPANTSLVLVTTCLAAAAGGIGAAIFSAFFYKSLDVTMFMNGVLGGLVGITAGADQMLPESSIIIGLIAGVLVVLGVAFLDKCKLDDPVGAIPVHLFCGIWGTLAVGLFGAMKGFDQFFVQLACVGITGAFCVIMGSIIVLAVKKIVGLRVDEAEEAKGLDLAEHGSKAYGDFSIN